MCFYNLYDRKFQLWFYQVSHSEAIIRSYKCNSNIESNLDVYLGDIHYLEIPCVFEGLKIKKTTEKDIKYILGKTNLDISEKNVIVLEVRNKKYYIVASLIKLLENNLPFEMLPIHIFFDKSIHEIQAVKKKEIKNIRTHRMFQLWFYQIINSEAIIRSNKLKINEDEDFTIDIHIMNIQYFEVPCIFQGMEIGSANECDMKYLCSKMNRYISSEQIIVFISEGKRYYIVADSFKVYKSNLDYSEMPIDQHLVNVC